METKRGRDSLPTTMPESKRGTSDPFNIKYPGRPIDDEFKQKYHKSRILYEKFSEQVRDPSKRLGARGIIGANSIKYITSGKYNNIYAFLPDAKMPKGIPRNALIRASKPVINTKPGPSDHEIVKSAKNALKASLLGIGPEIYDINFSDDRGTIMIMEGYTSNLGDFLSQFRVRSGVYTMPGNPGPQNENAAAEEYLQTRTEHILRLMAFNNMYCIDIKPVNMILKYAVLESSVGESSVGESSVNYHIEKLVGIDFDVDFCDDGDMNEELAFRSMLLLFGYHLFAYEYNYLDMVINRLISRKPNPGSFDLFTIAGFLFPPITDFSQEWFGVLPPNSSVYLSIIMILQRDDVFPSEKKPGYIIPPTTRLVLVRRVLCNYFRDYSLPVLFLFWFPFLRNRHMFLHSSPEATANTIRDVYSDIGVDIIVPKLRKSVTPPPYYNALVIRSECVDRVADLPVLTPAETSGRITGNMPPLIIDDICESAEELAPSLGDHVQAIREQAIRVFGKRGGQFTQRKKPPQTRRINRARLSRRQTNKPHSSRRPRK